MSILILGDICPSWGNKDVFQKGNAAEIFGDVSAELQGASFTVANLEAPVSEHGSKIVKSGVCLCCAPKDLEVLRAAPIKALSLANNHILDYGEQGLKDTLIAASNAKIAVFGAEKDAKTAAEPFFFEAEGKHIGMLSFAEEEFNCAGSNAPGANLFDPYYSLEQITATKAQCDYLVVLYHGGIEHYEYPSPLLQKKCRAMVRAGADLVLCQHSHCIGTFEEYENASILYGQGNAVFGYSEHNESWNQGLLVSLSFDGGQPNISFRVIEARQGGIRFASEETNRNRLERMAEQSACLNDPTELKKKWDAFCEAQTPEYLPELLCWGRVGGKLNRMLKGKPVKYLISRRKKMIAMNLVRCDAHREVVRTVLENTQKQESL